MAGEGERKCQKPSTQVGDQACLCNVGLPNATRHTPTRGYVQAVPNCYQAICRPGFSRHRRSITFQSSEIRRVSRIDYPIKLVRSMVRSRGLGWRCKQRNAKPVNGTGSGSEVTECRVSKVLTLRKTVRLVQITLPI